LKSFLITILVCLLQCSLASGQQNVHQPFIVAEVIPIHSRVLNEDRSIYIYNPDVAGGNLLPAYPVLYLLDENDMTLVTGLVKYLSAYNEQMPAMIVVGIDGSNRIRDMTPTHSTVDNLGKLDTSPDSWLKPSGGGEKFLQFLKEEVMPYVEQHYKTAPFKILAGHSVGGLAAIYCLLAHPDMFNAYIAISPSLWWDEGYMLSLAKSKLDSQGTGKKFLFVCNSPETGRFNHYLTGFVSLLKQKKRPGLEYRHTYYPTETHGSIAAKAHYDALRFIYPQWDIAPTDTTAALIKKHYLRLSERLGYAVEPPLGMVSDWGYRFLNDGKTDDAIELFQLNVKHFPASSDVYSNLGDAYVRKGDRSRARANYKKALELNPSSTETESKLKTVEGGK